MDEKITDNAEPASRLCDRFVYYFVINADRLCDTISPFYLVEILVLCKYLNSPLWWLLSFIIISQFVNDYF